MGRRRPRRRPADHRDRCYRLGKTIEAGLEIRLAPGWHAYWRSPGDAGIPPSIDWAGSENLSRAEIAWPAPARYSLQGFETAGYRDHVVLPITANPGAARAAPRSACAGELGGLRQYLRAVFDKAGPATAGRARYAVAGGRADRRRPAPRSRNPSPRRGSSSSRPMWRPVAPTRPSPSGCAARSTVRDARPVCRRVGQRFARPARGGAFASGSYGAADRADPRCGRRRHRRQKADSDLGRRRQRGRIHATPSPASPRRRCLAAACRSSPSPCSAGLC